MANRDLVAGALQKPMKGEALLDSRQRRADRVAQEQREMQAALHRDQRRCRFQPCVYEPKKLPIDPCHQQHRGMGGDPSGERTTRESIVSLCRVHHGMYDRGEIDVQPRTDRGFDDVCDLYQVNPITGHLEHVASEVRIGISEPRA